jgi:hypothetical protein
MKINRNCGIVAQMAGQSDGRRGRRALMRTSALLAAVAATTAASARAVEKDVSNGTTDLTSSTGYATAGAPGTTDDLTFTNITYSPTTFNVGSAGLSIGTLDDLDNTGQTLTITNTSSGAALTLNGDGGNNTVASGNGGAAGDLLYVASEGTFNTPSVLGVSVTTSGNYDAAGNASIGGPFTAAPGLTLTMTGAGTLGFGTNNLSSNLANWVVAAGTLSNNTASALGGGTITLGVSGGTANATILDNANVNLTNAITVAAGDTGTLRLAGGVGNISPSFTGLVTLANNVTIDQRAAAPRRDDGHRQRDH